MKINLHELLLENRHESVEEGHTEFSERKAWKMWRQGMLRRKWMNMANGPIKGWMVNKLVKGWSANRASLQIPKKSFNQQWRERENASR